MSAVKAIEVKKLTKKFGETTAVDNLELTVYKGEIFALLGVNGAGKTTTIKMLTTLLAPTLGGAEILGNDIVAQRQRVKRLTNVSPQETAVGAKLSVIENLEFIARVYGAKGKEASEKTQKMVDELGMSSFKNQKAGTLSGGQKRRLSIAMALISEPEVLFLDEPTLGLDVLARRELWSLIESLKGKVTVILTTHYLEEAEVLSDRIGIMVKGQLKAVGTAEELMALSETDKFEEAFIKLSQEV